MKHFRKIVLPLFCILAAASCQRQAGDVWDDTKTAGRYMGRGVRSLGGKHGDSRQVPSREAFGIANNYQNHFIPLYDEEARSSVALGEIETIPQAKETPGDPGSPIPGVDAFMDPSHNAQLASLFKKISFPYNSELVKGKENLETVKTIANYLRQHPNMHVFIEGHCDERGPQAYNLALGMRRANAVRTMLVKEGVDLNKLFTVSYGKERPLVFGESETFWAENRRAQFKVYQR